MSLSISFNFILILSLGTNSDCRQGGLNTIVEQLSELDPVTLFQRKSNPDISLPAPGLITKYGFPVESHEVTTDDGYILTVHRIPYGINSSQSTESKRAVLLQHGLLSSSDDWILNGPDKSLGFQLANSGYDVWLMNSRGNKYSRKHISLAPGRMKFWQFGFHEIGINDIPAVINTVLNKTGQKTVDLIGHNIAAAEIIALLSTKPEYNEKIRQVSLMGPTVFGNNMKSPIRYLGPFTYLESIILDVVGNGELIPSFLVQLLNYVAPTICTPRHLAISLCESPIYLFAGFDTVQANYSQIPIILGHRSTTSTRTFIHFLQSVVSPTFRKYDYGVIRNRRIYGTTLPPDYTLKNAKVPFAIYWGENDLLADPRDVSRLAAELPNVIQNRKVDFSQWNHIDFLFGIDAKKLVYNQLIEDLS